MSELVGAHFTYKSQRAREPATNCGGGSIMRWKRLEAASERASQFAVAAAAEAAASPACLLPLQSCSLPAKGKTIPVTPFEGGVKSASGREEGGGGRKCSRSPSLRSLARHRACICPSSIYGDSCHCGGRENEEESANSI